MVSRIIRGSSRHAGKRGGLLSGPRPSRRDTFCRLAAHLAVSARYTSAAGRCVSEAGVDVEPGRNSPWTKPSLSAGLATEAAGLQVIIIDLDPAACRNGGAGHRAKGHRQAR